MRNSHLTFKTVSETGMGTQGNQLPLLYHCTQPSAPPHLDMIRFLDIVHTKPVSHYCGMWVRLSSSAATRQQDEHHVDVWWTAR